MKIRNKRRKIKKVRTTISIDADIFEESGLYIYNLSAFVQECMKREIDKGKAKLRITSIKSTNDYIPEVPHTDNTSIEELMLLLK